MTAEGRPRTLGELKKSGYKSTSVKEEMRRNLIARIRRRFLPMRSYYQSYL
jgi:magnesium chelatase subunit I